MRYSVKHGTREYALGAGFLLATMVASVVYVKGGILFHWPFWLDEYHTLFLAERGSLLRSMGDLRAGVDFNPPLLYLIERLIGHLTGGITEVSLRVTSFVIVWLALAFVYFALVRIVSPMAAFLGALVLWCDKLTVEHAFEGRFYGPWLLFAAMLVWSLGLDADRSESRRRDIAVALSSILLCTIHYFGIFSMLLITAGAFTWMRGSEKHWRRLLPVVTGPIALLACAPFYLGQRRALTVTTWVPDVSTDQVREMAATYFAAPPFVVGILLLLATAAWTKYRSSNNQSRPRGNLSFAAPFFFLLLMPVVVYLISVLIQPSMMVRYAIVGLLGWAPIVALGADALPLVGKVGVFLFLFFTSTQALRSRVAEVTAFQTKTETEAAAVRPFLESGASVMVTTRHSLYPLARTTNRPAQFVYPDFTDSTAHARGFPPWIIVERDVARIHQKRYGFPSLRRVDANVAANDVKFFVPNNENISLVSMWFPNHEAIPVGSQVYRLSSFPTATANSSGEQMTRAMSLLYSQQKPEAAIPVLDSILAREPGHYGALWQRAAALEAARRKPEAIQAWRGAIAEAERMGYSEGLQQARDRLASLLR